LIRYRTSSILYKILVQAVFIFISLTILFALYYLISNALKTSVEFSANQFTPPKRLNLSNFLYVWKDGGIGITFRNSMIICSTSVTISIFVALISGFAFSYLRFMGKRILSYLILSTMYISPMALVIPLFLQMGKLRLTNTYTGIIITYVALNLAFSVYLMTTYLKGIPEEIVEAAVMDGCSNFGLLFRIFIPLSKAGIFVLGIINFSLMWNDLLFAFIFLQKHEKQTIMVAIAKFQGMYGHANMTHILSALVIAALPIIVIYLVAQRFFKEGVMSGSVK
jgi:ABC-type glycerol-3-phosphate transport system permease component